MNLDSGWAGAIGSIVSALIIAVTAIAAFRQLKQVRNANDIVVYLRLIDTMDSPELLEARRDLAAVSAKFAADAAYRDAMRDPAFIPEDFRNVGPLLRFLEHMSVLVSKGGVAESLVLAEYADTFVQIWEQMRPVILQRRHAFGMHTGRAFEHLAMRSKRYIDSGAMDREYAALERDLREA